MKVYSNACKVYIQQLVISEKNIAMLYSILNMMKTNHVRTKDNSRIYWTIIINGKKKKKIHSKKKN